MHIALPKMDIEIMSLFTVSANITVLTYFVLNAELVKVVDHILFHK